MTTSKTSESVTPGTAPAPTTTATPASWVSTYAAWIKAHENILIILFAAVLLYKGGRGVENIILKRDQAAASKATVVVQQDTTSNKQLQDQLAQMKSAADEQIAKLESDIKSQAANLKIQQQKDAVSTPAEIDTRWQKILPLKPGSVTPLSPTTTSVTDEAANETVQALEQLPVLKDQITDLTTEVNYDQKIIIQQDSTIAGLNKQLTDETAKDVADVAVEKAKAKKSFWKGLKLGIVIGVVGTEVVRVWAGHP